MTRREKIELLQDQVQHNRIEKQEFFDKCKEWGLDWCEDVLFPIGYNICDRCEDYGDSELDFLWLDGFDWEDDNEDDKAIQKALSEEPIDYCAICWKCVNELKEKGKEKA